MGILKKIGLWFEDRTGIAAAIGPILTHKVPPTNWKNGWWYVLGSATLISLIIQVVTGIALSTSYVTSTGDAYNSLLFITNQATFGNFLRGMHAWSASAMILFVGLHALHVYLIGAYKFPREMNWLSGIFLLLLTIAMGFTGQLLRWDQTAFWSIIVGAQQAGRTPIIGEWLAKFIMAGDTVGGATLSRFYAFHVFFIPAIIFGLLGFHLFLVIRNGVSEPPKRGEVVDPKTYRQKYHELLEKEGVPFWPDALWRDVVAGVVIIAGIIALAMLQGPPELGRPPDPTNLQAYPRPDWYFLWYFSVLALSPSGVENYVILGAPAVIGLVLITLPLFANKGERAPSRRPWSVAAVVAIVVMVGALWIAGLQSNWSPNTEATQIPEKVVASTDAKVQQGAKLFYDKGCIYCHMISGNGGQRGPNLTNAGDRLTADLLTIRINNGGNNMPAYGANLTSDDIRALVAFLQSRKTVNNQQVAQSGSK